MRSLAGTLRMPILVAFFRWFNEPPAFSLRNLNLKKMIKSWTRIGRNETRKREEYRHGSYHPFSICIHAPRA